MYGIVKQNRGAIDVESTPEMGTTFKIYLRRFAGQGSDAQGEEDAGIPRSRGETVLVVEDEPALLKMDKMMLERLGYRVLAAGAPREAIGSATAHAGGIDLLLTDVVVPEMNGRDMAGRMRSHHPGTKVLFMSSHMTDVIAHRGVLDKGMHFIQKPFSMKELAVKLRAALGDR